MAHMFMVCSGGKRFYIDCIFHSGVVVMDGAEPVVEWPFIKGQKEGGDPAVGAVGVVHDIDASPSQYEIVVGGGSPEAEGGSGPGGGSGGSERPGGSGKTSRGRAGTCAPT